MPFRPSRCKRLRYFKPATITAKAMVGAHAGALTFVSHGIHTGWCTNFLISKGLNNVNSAKPFECSVHKVIEPGLGCFPKFFLPIPVGIIPSPIFQPLAIRWLQRQSHAKPLSLSASAKYDWYLFLVPDCLQCFVVFVHLQKLHQLFQHAMLNLTASAPATTGAPDHRDWNSGDTMPINLPQAASAIPTSSHRFRA
jgi:hypothetical protein